MNVPTTFALLIAFSFLPGFGSGERWFAPSSDLWRHWATHDATAQDSIDHGIWDGLLARHVREDKSGVNLVDYRGFSTADRAGLNRYIGSLAGVPISRFQRDEQLAYWINFYNALTVDVVLDNFPVDSIRDINISPGIFALGPWDKKLVMVEGEQISLNDIEHRILRPIWSDPRIHYALNCASIGCPNLRMRAYSSEGIHQTLTEAATQFVNDPRGVTISDSQVTVSRIYDWFIDDFGGTEQAVLRHLLEFAAPGLAAQLTDIGELADTQYDWSINAVM